MTRFVISDHHFNHKNIIEYTNRPFDDVDEMNQYMIQKWNDVVGDGDSVIHGGDIAFGSISYVNDILGDLNGSKMVIEGNHDDYSPDNVIIPMVEDTIIQHEGFRFWYTHRPDNVPEDWNQWVLHGHVHDDMDFIDYRNNRVNVSVEQIGYVPIPLNIITKALSKMSNEDKSKTIKDSPISDFEWYNSIEYSY